MVIASHINKSFLSQIPRSRATGYLTPRARSDDANTFAPSSLCLRANKQVLKEVSFHIKPGERVGIIGLNGSGKTTLMRILTGALRADSGYLRIAGEKPWEWEKNKKVRIGIVSAGQSNLHHDKTVGDSIKLCRKMYPDAWSYSYMPSCKLGISPAAFFNRKSTLHFLKEGMEVMDYVGKCLKIKDIWKEFGSSLSSGERMRAEFLYAIMMNPHLLVMDEPTTGMDYEMRSREYECLEYFREHHKPTPLTTLLVTHNIQEMERLCERVIAIQNGQVIFDGTVEYLQQKYLSLGKICFEIEEGVLQFQDMPIQRYEIDGKKVQLTFDKRYVGANIILRQMMEKAVIRNIRIFAMDMESIIRNLYQENRQSTIPYGQ